MAEFNRLGAQGLVESRCIWAEHLQHSVNVFYGDHGTLHVDAKDSLLAFHLWCLAYYAGLYPATSRRAIQLKIGADSLGLMQSRTSPKADPQQMARSGVRHGGSLGTEGFATGCVQGDSS
jgi:hypothetical protein